MINKIEQNFRDKLLLIYNKLIAVVEKKLKNEKEHQEIQSELINSWVTEDSFLIELSNSINSVINHFEYNCIFIQTYSITEYFVIKVCKEYDRKFETKCFEDKYRLSLIDCKAFIRCQLGHNFDNDENWANLLYYNKLRNLLVHNIGIINIEQEKKSFLEQVKSDKNIIIIEEGSLAYIKNADFLYGALNVSNKFFSELCELIRKKNNEKNYLPPFALFPLPK